MDQALTLFTTRAPGFTFVTFYKVHAGLGFCKTSTPHAYVGFRIENREMIFDPSNVIVLSENATSESVLSSLKQLFPIFGFTYR